MRTFFVSNLNLEFNGQIVFETYFPEAEAVSIAGNISADPDVARKALHQLSSLYNLVVFVRGELDIGHDNVIEKIDTLDNDIRKCTSHSRMKKKMGLQGAPIHLKSSMEPLYYGHVRFSGSDTIPDNFLLSDDFEERMKEIGDEEYRKTFGQINLDAVRSASPDTSIFVVRQCPIIPGFNNLPWRFRYDDVMACFDAKSIFDTLPDNVIIHYGYTKWKDKRTVKLNGKHFTFICNSLDSIWPEDRYNAKDYIIDI